VTFDMPAWWTPAIGPEALATHSPRNDHTAEPEKAASLVRWVKERHPTEPTTALVARLK
jgi:hypothetical protein